jgi:ATP-dependent Clp protease ATP-binding subunit ClpA
MDPESLSNRTPHVCVTPDDVCRVLEAWTGVRASRIVASRFRSADIDELHRALSERVFGQQSAIDALAAGLQRRFRLPERAGQRRPIWTAVFAGPSGVGKTQLARDLAEHFFGEPANHLVQIDLSEFREEHTIARLVGSPPGYKGHGEGGQLTNALRRTKTGVIVLDEVEKAHEAILTTIVMPLVGEGVVHDMNDGRVLDATNMIVILTSNLGSDSDEERAVGFAPAPELGESDTAERAARAAVASFFPPEILGRIDDIVVFRHLSDEAVHRIWQREEQCLEQRLASGQTIVRIDVNPDAERLCLDEVRTTIRRDGARAVMRLFDKAIVGKCLDMLPETAGGSWVLRVEAAEPRSLRYSLTAA